MSFDTDSFASDIFGIEEEEEILRMEQLSDRLPRSLSKGSLANGHGFHIYLDTQEPQLVLVEFSQDVLVKCSKSDVIYPIQIGTITALDHSAQDPEFTQQMISAGYSHELFMEGEYEKRLHEPVISSLKLPSS